MALGIRRMWNISERPEVGWQPPNVSGPRLSNLISSLAGL